MYIQKKRNRNVLYAMMYGAGPRTASRLFMQSKQNRRMPARARKKMFNKLKSDFDIFCAMTWDTSKANLVHDELQIELHSKR